jgi:DNA helicase-2/ATP-dependent DNA helicase PcrA
MNQNLILQNLNLQQQKACQILSGPILILAGAGTGKTKTITSRVAYLISRGVLPENILAVTFTNKAAQEMKNRIYKLISNPLPPISNFQLLNCGTFHSICARILRHEVKHLGYGLNFVIYDEDDQVQLIKKIMEELALDPKRFAPAMISAMIASAKSEFIDAKDYQENYAWDFLSKIAGKIYEKYQKTLFEANAMDFEDLIFNCVLLFRKNLAILKKYQERFKYILVDEYQDTNHLQYLFVNFLSQKHRNLCVCGDDWQAIYGWRNANIQNILNFEKDFPECKIIKLEQNYRSTQNILDSADLVIRQNLNQKDKKLWTKKGHGAKVFLCETKNEKSEGEFIIQKIEKQRQKDQKLSYSDFAVLYRTHAQSRALEEAFLRYGIAYQIVGGVKFYQRREIKDIIAYLRLILNPYDRLAFLRVINTPPRGLGKKTCEEIVKLSRDKKLDFISGAREFAFGKISSKMKNSICGFVGFYKLAKEKAKELKLTELINFVCQKSSYKDYLCDGTEEGNTRWENVKELLSVAGKYDDKNFQFPISNFQSNHKSQIPNDQNQHLLAPGAFLEEVALLSEVDEWEEKNEAVTLMTLHSAKGLEFEVVFLAGLEENLLPHSKTLFEPAELEEERRLCYVGMTRAKNYLYLVYARTRKIFGQISANQISRFAADLPEELVEKMITEIIFTGSPNLFGELSEATDLFGILSKLRHPNKKPQP